MPSALEQALKVLIWAIILFLLFFIIWLFYCDCRRWAAAAEIPSFLAIHSPMCPAGDGKALVGLRMHPARLG
jgi:hypothetical protein